MSKNLGNVMGVVKGLTPPMEADGVTEKRYVLWAKQLNTVVPLKYALYHYDTTQNNWKPLVEVSETDLLTLKFLIFGTLNDPELPVILGENNLMGFLTHKLKVRYIDLQQGQFISDFFSPAPTPPALDKFFVVDKNELVIFRQAELLSGEYVGWSLHLFKNSMGKYGLSGTLGTNLAGNIQPCYPSDFITINQNTLASEVGIKEFDFNSLLGYRDGTLDYNIPTVEQALSRLFKDSMSKLNMPPLGFFWGEKPYFEHGLRKRALGVHIPFWETINDFRNAGGKVFLELWRRKERKTAGGKNGFGVFRPDDYYFESRPDLSGRVNSIEVLNGSDYYGKFTFEEYFSGHRSNFNSGAFPSDAGTASNNKRTYEKRRFAFKLRFVGSNVAYRTPIVGEIICQINKRDKYLSFKRI